MSFQFMGNNGGRSPCYRFFEDMMICVREEGVHRQMYKCHEQKADFKECVQNGKKGKRVMEIKKHKAQLIKEGKWPPKE